MIKKSKVLEKLRNGEVVFGCQVRTCSAMVAELYGYCGFDFVFIEGEHFPCSPETVLEVARGCEIGGAEAILRIPDHDVSSILQYLDMGISGMLFPHVDTAKQAKAIMEAAKYAPVGKRGFSNTSRATGYGFLSMKDYKALANENTMIIPFIESKEAVRNLKSIMDEGIDALHIGPGDLAESYQVPVYDRMVQDAIDHIFNTANAANVPVGIPAATTAEAKDYIVRGARIISFSSDLAILKDACIGALKEMKQQL